jgi:hypothetical protein
MRQAPTYDIGYPGPGMRQAQTCSRIIPVNVITTYFFFLFIVTFVKLLTL